MDEETRLAIKTVERYIDQQRKTRNALIIFGVLVAVTNFALLIVTLTRR